jgi:peptide/nickel transport system permease protein
MVTKAAAWVVLAATAIAALGAGVLAPHDPSARYPNLLDAPPTRVQLRDASGQWRAPFVYPWRRVSQLEQTYERDTTRVVPLTWFSAGRVVQSSDDAAAPLLILGADSYGRDLFSRILHGARLSLGLAVVAALGALLLGTLAGGVGGFLGGAPDEALSALSEFVLVLPAIYVALILRSVLPLVLSAGEVFALLAAIFAVIGAPHVARVVRGVVAVERTRDYVAAAQSLGASRRRVLLRHLLPAASGVLAVQTTLLVPAFVVAEATLSYVGLGFPEPSASWGTMLGEAATTRAFSDFPWLLTPAVAMFAVVFAINLAMERNKG